jgi:hypothetical protein
MREVRDEQLDDRQRRVRLRELDACLHILENALEQDETRMSRGLASRLFPCVQGIWPGMTLTQALDRAFEAQEAYLLPGECVVNRAPGPSPPQVSGVEPPPVMALLEVASRTTASSPPAPVPVLDRASARTLTERIRRARRETCVLLLEAHERRAASALGYATWEQYVTTEFGLSRSRSYELLDQGRVIVSVQSTVGVDELPDISAYAASQVKTQLPELLRALRARLPSTGAQDVQSLITELVRSFRKRAGQQVASRRGGPEGGGALSSAARRRRAVTAEPARSA